DATEGSWRMGLRLDGRGSAASAEACHGDRVEIDTVEPAADPGPEHAAADGGRGTESRAGMRTGHAEADVQDGSETPDTEDSQDSQPAETALFDVPAQMATLREKLR